MSVYDVLAAFGALILTADASATRYFGRGTGSYTVWTEYELDGLYAGNELSEIKWRILVERYSTAQDDPVARAIMSVLSTAPNVAFRYSLRRSNDQEIIYHAWDCEVT